MFTFPSSVPSGTNIIPAISGTSSLGSSAYPFSTIFTNNIVSSGSSGEFVNISGDTMTGPLTVNATISGTRLFATNWDLREAGGADTLKARDNKSAIGYFPSSNTMQFADSTVTASIAGSGIRFQSNIDDIKIAQSNITPTASGENNIGSTSLPFLGVYAKTGYFTNLSGLSPITIKSDMIPVASGNINLGTLSLPFSGTFTNYINNETVVISRFNEEPSGLINGSNSIFTLISTPFNNSLQLYKNGLYMTPSGVSSNFDYVLSGNTISYITAPVSGSNHITNYNFR